MSDNFSNVNRDKIKISVKGCCVSRDALEYRINKYEVQKYAAGTSPWTILNGNKVDISTDELLKTGVSHFAARCMQHDAQLSTFDFLKEQISDWLLLDLADVRLRVIEWEKQNVVLSESFSFGKASKVFIKKLGSDYAITSPLNLPWDEFKHRLDNFI
ncbi:MAG: DUF6270 domain-containing protein, partial [Prevotella sp.]|nr:DUF6270 domain-containing protein [Prevotella sp.]